MVKKFQIIVVPDDATREQEQMGTKPKFWYDDGTHGYCLYKEGHPNTGEDWAERVVSELCELLALPHATYKLAVYQGRNGVITPNFVKENEILVPGNQVLFGRGDNYPMGQRFRVKKHTIERIFTSFEPLQVQLPIETAPPEITTAQQVFVGYLLLDVWVGNTDRHHENWALVQRVENGVITNRLAPTHDHAASLGSILQDEERGKRLTTRDKGFMVEKYVERGRSALYQNEADKSPLLLIDAFRVASTFNPNAARIWLGKLEAVTMQTVVSVFDRFPDGYISEEARQFAIKMLEINRQRLLEIRVQ